MAQTPRPRSLIDSLGEEIVRIVCPVSICMFLVVILVSLLNSSSDPTINVSSIATIAYDETDSDSSWDKFVGALLNSLVFVAVVTVVTFVLVLLFYLRCTRFLRYYMGFSAFVVLGLLGGEVSVFLIEKFSIPIDCVTFAIVLFNFAIVGVLAVFASRMAIFVTQAYLVIIGMLVAYWFTMLPEWTTWVLLVAMALYDLAAVLLPVGPLRLLVELAISRDEEIPALVYEARPVNYQDSGGIVQRRVWRDQQRGSNPGTDENSVNRSNSREHSDSGNEVYPSLPATEDFSARVQVADESEISAPLINSRPSMEMHSQRNAAQSENLALEGIGLGSSGAIKLGLGDFIFYSVLVGRAAMYDTMTVYACYLAIIAGLGITLMLLALYQKALPALPVSILLG
ncbi:hypothetical protein MLD38_025013 [Melastoma candidum]|uniref:Uncharacterized protein n=1 Tax=Melastoma candidum TaxID=119954 RepID=A0ACB9NUH4_9MYRT|nr:hypothetical protein MLD38_025013 [Melastoma candidum]